MTRSPDRPDPGRPTTEDLLAGLRERCMALPEVTEASTHGAPTWFVRGRRSFAKFIDPEQHRFDERHVAFWSAAPPGARRELATADPRHFFEPPFGGYDWVGMRLDVDPQGPDWDEVREIVTDGYRRIAPKGLVSRVDGR